MITTPLAITTGEASEALPQSAAKPNAFEMARKMLYEPYQKLQETQDAAESKSRFIMEKIMENLELFASGEEVSFTLVDA